MKIIINAILLRSTFCLVMLFSAVACFVSLVDTLEILEEWLKEVAEMVSKEKVR